MWCHCFTVVVLQLTVVGKSLGSLTRYSALVRYERDGADSISETVRWDP